MAHDNLSSSIGLNEITTLREHDMDGETPRKSGFSRIPKLHFSFRKASPARDVSPEVISGNRNNADSVKSAPSSKQSSPGVSRSKSLRLPRTNYMAKCPSSSAVSSMRKQAEEEEDDWGSYGHQRPSRSSLLKPRGRTNAGTSSTPGSRSSSPGIQMNISRSQTDSSSSSTELQLEPTDGAVESSSSSRYHRRSSSFSSSAARHRVQTKTSNVSIRERGHVRPSSASRSKTPSSASRNGSQRSTTSSSEPRNMPLTRTNSVGQIVKESSSGSRSSTPTHQVRRMDSNGSISSTGSRNRPRRPSSMIFSDGSADLNKLAQEVSSSFVTSDTSEPEMKSASRASGGLPRMRQRSRTYTRIPTVKCAMSPYDRNSTPSPTERAVPRSYEQSTVSSRAKLPPPGRSGSFDRDRPSSARAYYDSQQTPPSERNAPDETDFGLKASVGSVAKKSVSRSSTPSQSGRSSPVPRETVASAKRIGPQATPTGDPGSGSGQVSSVAVSRVTGLPPRTPYRVARTRATTLAGSELATGINELEGCVLLEADDYRRISNEVKALKTALLRLKRELQGDQEDGSALTSTTKLMGRRGSPAGSGPSGATVSELNKKLQQVTSERDKARGEVAQLKKDVKSRSTRLSQLTSELQTAKEEKERESERFKQMEAHRDHLLDKVERLHADKHKLEDKLNSLEKIRFYERTLSESAWLEDLDGEETMVGQLERRETESDLGDSLMLSDGGEGESSEPESSAVCSTPLS